MQLNNQKNIQFKELYKKDETAWILENVKLLRQGKLNEIDSENIATILEEEVISYRLEVKRKIRQIIQFLLQFQYQKKFRREKYWKKQMHLLRSDLEFDFENSQSLEDYAKDNLHTIYIRGKKLASTQMEIPVETIPDTCPFTFNEIMDENFFLKKDS
jgi:hypothetical protein